MYYITHSQVIVIRVPEWTTSTLESTLAALSNELFISPADHNVINIIIVGHFAIYHFLSEYQRT